MFVLSQAPPSQSERRTLRNCAEIAYSWQCESYYRIMRSRRDGEIAAGGNHNILFAVAPQIGDGMAMSTRGQLRDPEFLAGPGIERTEPAVIRRANEHQAAGS